jgi:hypothetical protein
VEADISTTNRGLPVTPSSFSRPLLSRAPYSAETIAEESPKINSAEIWYSLPRSSVALRTAWIRTISLPGYV